MKIKMPDITATGVLALAVLAVGGYVIYKASQTVGEAVTWVNKKVGQVADATISEAKALVQPLSTNKVIITKPLNDTSISDEEIAWRNQWINMMTANGA